MLASQLVRLRRLRRGGGDNTTIDERGNLKLLSLSEQNLGSQGLHCKF